MLRTLKHIWTFLPSTKEELEEMFDIFFANVEDFEVNWIKAVVSPHAWYIYSWQVAAYSYEAIRQNIDKIPKNIFILTPDHYIWMNKVLVGNYDFLETPFWNLKVNKKITNELLENKNFTQEFLDLEKEHALETQLPFLAYVLGEQINDFQVIPLIFWQVDIIEIAKILDKYVSEALFIVSSDLSHYHSYDQAQLIDQKTIKIALEKDLNNLSYMDACGIYPWACLLVLANKYSWQAKLLKYLNSWDTAWDKSHVVWYASIVYY